MVSDTVIPAKVGDPCPIQYVLYIIKENRTYDQVMSDMTDKNGKPIGNGDAKLLMYGEKVTPSPYGKRGTVDSTLYTMASMIRAMELILGRPPLTQYDARATPMFRAFTKDARLSEYTALTPAIDLNAKNTSKTAFSKESGWMNFKAYDLAPEDEINRILWAVARPGEPYPTPIHRAIFAKPMDGK